ncbi:zf-MIZ-domain-containing protein, partial [Martensiomyces pterosporus]
MCGYSDACENSNNPTGRPATIEFPQSLSVAANGSPVHQAHSARGRSKSPISLTARINKVVGFKNTVQISYSSFARWVAAVVLAKHHTSKSIIGELRKTSFVSADAVRKQFFKGSDDDDVISAGALVSLKCPLGLSRINTPMRSRFCQHSQCFDGETFLQLNQQTPSWKCPICSISVKSWRELIVDGYFEAILMGTSPNDDQV